MKKQRTQDFKNNKKNKKQKVMNVDKRNQKENVPQEDNKVTSIHNKVATKSKPKMKAKQADGGRPVKKSTKEANKQARIAIKAGDITKDETDRKKEQDSRTLYVRFGDKTQLPSTADQIKELHPHIKFVRTPRTAVKGKKTEPAIGYAFVEFGNPEECKEAHKKLSTTLYKGKELIVDFVGEKSKNKKQKSQAQTNQATSRLNPTRLFICGLAPGVTQTHLKEMFPKASHADIPSRSRKKGTSYGFVQFATPGDAKAAFDAAKNLSIADHKITVLYAKITETKPEVLKKKAEKRKAKKQSSDETESKKGKTENQDNEESGNENDEEDSDEEETDNVKKESDDEEDDENDEESDEESEKAEESVKKAEEDNDQEEDDDDDDENEEDDEDDEDDENDKDDDEDDEDDEDD